MRKKHNKPKNIRRKDEHFKYFLFEINHGHTNEIFIHKETQKIPDIDEYINNKFEAIYDYFEPRVVELEISPLGEYEYKELDYLGATKLMTLWNS